MGLIKYNGVNPFSGQADPMVSMSTSYDDNDGKWSRTDAYTFDGQFTGCSFDELINRQESLVVAFSQDFKELEIIGFDITGASNLVTRVPNISFGDSNYLGATSYTVQVECREFEKEGVKDPSDTITFANSEDDTMSISHSVSCVGVESGNCDALQTAINWVNGRLDISARKPLLIPGYSLDRAILTSFNEDIDRMGYSYGISRNFKINKNDEDEPVLRYTTQTCTDQGSTKVSINGSVEGGDAYSQDEVDSMFNNFIQQYPYLFTSYSVDYDNKENSLSFNFSYEEDGTNVDDSQVTNNYSISWNEDAEGHVSITIDGCYEIANKCGPTAYDLVKTEAGAEKSMANGAKGVALGEDASLNDSPTSYSITYNEFDAKICYNYNFDNKPQQDEGVSSWSADFVVPVVLMKIIPVLNFGTCADIIMSLGYTNRATISFNVEAESAAEAKKFIDSKFRELCPDAPRVAITSDQINSKDGGGVSVAYAASFEGKAANTVEDPTTISSDLKIA